MADDKNSKIDEKAEIKQEQELVESLTRVNEAYNQLKDMRVVITHMLQPFHAPAADPELIYSAFATAAQKAVKDIQGLQAIMKDSKMQELLKKSHQTIKSEGNTGIENWLGSVDGIQDDWMINEDAGAAMNGLDALKIERETPKKT